MAESRLILCSGCPQGWCEGEYDDGSGRWQCVPELDPQWRLPQYEGRITILQSEGDDPLEERIGGGGPMMEFDPAGPYEGPFSDPGSEED